MGNMVQSNSIGVAMENAFGIPAVAAGGCGCNCSRLYFFWAASSASLEVTEKIAPFMALGSYIVGCVAILCMNYAEVGEAFRQIFVMAFALQSVAGGVAGITVQKGHAFRRGARTVFNEAGMGSTPHAHAIAKVGKPRSRASRL